jgi:class 3 adenylate cyclase
MGSGVRFATTTDGVSIAHRIDGTGPSLVLARGWLTHLSHHDMLPELVAFLGVLRRHFRLVVFDARGNGLSDRRLDRPPTWDVLQLDLEAVMEQIEGPVILWGSGFGGPIAIRFAAANPSRVRHLILDNTFAEGAGLATGSAQRSFGDLMRLAPSQPHAVSATITALAGGDSGTDLDEGVVRLRQAIDPDLLLPFFALIPAADVRAEAATLSIPALVLHRTGLRTFPPRCGRDLASLIAGSELVLLPGRAQNLWDGEAQPALDAIGAFLGVDLGPLPASASLRTAQTGGPVGLGAVLFTDVVASTATTNRVGDDRAHAVIRLHNRIVRDALAAYGCREVKHTGDGIMAWSTSVSAALRAAIAIQQAVARSSSDDAGGEALAVKIGLNAGEPVAEDDDLFGAVVQLAQRACDAAVGGQILVTATVHDLAQGKGFPFGPVEHRQLKGFDAPVPLWPVELPAPSGTDSGVLDAGG